jgi:F-type H+-transporting ATPase subunit delta
MTLLAKRYATALHLAAQGQRAADAVDGDLQALAAGLAAPSARTLLLSPDLGAAERDRLLERLGAGRHALVQNLLGVLRERRRLDVLFDLAPAYHALRLHDRGEVEGVAESARPLDASAMSSLAALASRLSGKKVSLTANVQPELLGGVRLRVGNVLYDGSMKSALDQLEQQLLQAQL